MVQQIAVRAMQLQRVDAKPLGPLCGIDKRIADPHQPGIIERQWCQFALLVRDR
jgi:hypothetical protein